ncbi:MAG: aconitase X catalytic domain-containing protein [Hadesarchaea archaeon]|nr:aconitase X catalytic domain-containing protein [Hadesarchaea archaeon]
MRLTKEQEKMLSGEEGPAISKAMEILTALGDIYDAEKLIPIQSAHVSGISLRTSGEAGLKFVEDLANKGAKTRVKTTINPAGIDLEDWRELGAPEDMAKKQERMIKAYEKMGAEPTCSCIPYLIGNEPTFGKHLAWAESSAVVFANSVLGAKTNREGAPSALASALTGLTPKYGYHLKENRSGTIEIKPDLDLLKGEETFPYSVLGYWIGEKFPNSVPVIKNIHPNLNQLKSMGAAMATSGAIALFHIPEVTPEAKNDPSVCETSESAEFNSSDFNEVVEKLDQVSDPDIIFLGCPHFSMEELREIPSNTKNETWICLPRKIKETIDIKKIESEKVKLICDTCMVVAPLREMGYSSIGVNSAKAAHYAPMLADVKVHFAPMEELIK